MNTVTITTAEYRKLLAGSTQEKSLLKKRFLPVGFGIFKNSFGKSNSVKVVNKLRKSWRD